MKVTYNILYLGIILIAISCGSSGGGDGASDDTPPAIPAPIAATLVFPEDNTECNEGAILANDDTKSDVTFQWNASENTDTYEVNIRNLNTNTSTTTSTTTIDATITIDRGTPYEWFVVSKANGTNETASSSKAKFYNQGPGIENYAPFPAEAVNPNRGSTITTTTSVDLQWNSSDIDDDIIEFIVFFDTNENPSTEVGTVSENSFTVTVASGNTYYWKIRSRDSQNNSSNSEVFEFRVE